VTYLGVKRAFPPGPGGRVVACVGGSTTAGYPYPFAGFPEWLGHELGRAGAKDLTVRNRGVGSYGTRRESLVLEEVLKEKPAVVVLFTGHNDTREEQIHASLPGVLKGGLARAAWSSAAFTKAVRSAGRLSRRPDLGRAEGPWGLPSTMPVPRQEDVEAGFERRLRAMARASRESGALTLIVTAPVEPRYAPVSRSGAVPEDLSRALALREEGRRREAEKALEAAPACRARDDCAWLRGLLALEAGRTGEGRALLERVAERLRLATSAIRGAQRRVAAEEGARLVDFDALTRRGTKDGLPDPRFFSDNHHLSAYGYRALARALHAELAAAGLAPAPRPWDGRARPREELGLSPDYDAVPPALVGDQYALYYARTGNPWFRDRAVRTLAESFSLDLENALRRVHVELAPIRELALDACGRLPGAQACRRRVETLAQERG
jgi:lysophospholipase L1-like esterase